MEENKEIIVEETTQEEEVVEKQQSKFVTGLKKHGKKIAVFAAIAGGVIAGFVLGKRSNNTCDETEECDYDYDDAGSDSDTESEEE